MRHLSLQWEPSSTQHSTNQEIQVKEKILQNSKKMQDQGNNVHQESATIKIQRLKETHTRVHHRQWPQCQIPLQESQKQKTKGSNGQKTKQ